MTREEALFKVKGYLTDCLPSDDHEEVEEMIRALEEVSCEECISRQAAIDAVNIDNLHSGIVKALQSILAELPPATPQPKMGHCKDCKYFKHDSMAKVDGMPLIVAPEIYKRWSAGCRTKEDGYCFLYEPHESEE